MTLKYNYWMQKKCMLFLLVALFFAGCQKETLELENRSSLTTEVTELQDARHRLKTLITTKGTFTNLIELKKNSKFRQVTVDMGTQARSKKIGIPNTKILEQIQIDDHYHHMMEMAINPDDFECGPTFLNAYFAERTKNFTQDDFFFAQLFSMIPIYEAILIDDDSDVDYFGATGEFTNSQRRSFLRLNRFWDIPTTIQLADMHGAIFKDPATVSQLLLFLGFGFVDEEGNFTPFTQADADEFAELLKIVFGAPVFENYSHPILTFNAFALSGIPELGIPAKIVMGDGVLDGFAELGLRTTADKFILAHEYGHQIQFANGIIDVTVPPTPEGTRRTELMADAFASYYSAHGQGGFLQPLLISRFVKSAFSVGDCGFDFPSHHGTPNQRARAADFGGKLAERRGFIDQKYSSEEFARLFDEAFPQIVIPDSE